MTGCLHQPFEEHAAARPDAVAIVSDAGELSYGELDRRANQLALQLRARGVGPEVLVGLEIERSVETVVGILGVLKAGGAYVPLDPAYPRERRDFMIADTRLALVLTEWPPGGPEERVDGGAGPENLAYVIYTSGSTGTPKGIALRHAGVLNNLRDLNRRFTVGPGDRVLLVSSLSFDMSVYEILGTLAAGATIVIPDPEAGRDPALLVETLAARRVTIWNSAPALLQAVVDHLESRPRPLQLRLALLGGDWVPVTLPSRLQALAPGVTVAVMGGATEASIHSTLFVVEKTDPSWRSIPYGRAMDNQRCYVLDERLAPVADGEPGELYLGGVGLARGYLHRPELTAERFLPNPFVPGERIYKTGDRVRLLPDGNLELLGRLDHLIKLRGHRIEAGEIEARLREHPSVREAVVVLRDQRLVAYLTTRGPVMPSGLRARLHEKLPDYMVPSALVVLDALPLSPNGKVDRRALPPPPPSATTRPPRTPLEAELAAWWCELLRVPSVDVDDNFFELGGHSLLLTQLASRVRASRGVELPLRVMLNAVTVAELARAIETRLSRSPAGLVDELARLTPEEARALLDAERKP